ncbi:neurotransmitter:Na+ symporter, NSS family [Marinobacter antarcticus]|uniref:Neurotransmitter:Na+ symporter, NSS family n=1 Tax=Marinobacter antarcticus TaxID=564117 RepID=A0A1M6QQZ0_9GAMM|nr:sodium-dependent transporter [Marinobacter antarcticus]SHK22712.1 neurotransmitter:Na+ symporter, NSS family [Marinobacter antarcticus]
MPAPYQTHIGSFTRKSTFFWAAVGATVGLANLWQFPYLASLHGGGLFILLYLGCLLLVTLPLMVTEASIGRYARHGIVLAMDGLIRSAKSSRVWMAAGRLSILAAFLVLSFTAVFGAIALAYVFFGAMGRFSGAGQVEATSLLAGLVSDPRAYRVFMGWHAFFLIMVLWVSGQGVAGGLERAFRIVVPGTLILLLALFGLAAWHGRIDGAISQILEMHPQDLTWASLRAALFHAFYTLGLGMGVWAVLGAYTTPDTRLKRSILAVVLMDTLVAIMAGLMIFSMATESGVFDGERGFSLLFISLPITLAEIPASQFVIATVFLVVVMVVWATALALLEPVVGWFREWTGAPRGLSVVLLGLAVWLAGLVSLFSFNVWAEYRFGGATVFRWLELTSGGLMIPLVAILIALFTGWCLTRNLSKTMLGAAPKLFGTIWFWVMRLVLPLVVVYIGIQYTAASLVNLCDNGSKAFWCEPAPGMVFRDESGASPEAADVGESGAVSDGAGEGGGELLPAVQAPASEHSEQKSAPENAPKDDDILYHSV